MTRERVLLLLLLNNNARLLHRRAAFFNNSFRLSPFYPSIYRAANQDNMIDAEKYLVDTLIKINNFKNKIRYHNMYTENKRMIVFDKTSTKPMYEQVAEYFKGLISNGTLIHGSTLLSQRDYCDFFGVSRSTIDKAFSTLTHEGLITLQPKKRAIVRLDQHEQTISSIDWEQYTKRAGYHELDDSLKNVSYVRGDHNFINLHECYFGQEFDPYKPIKEAMTLAAKHALPRQHHTDLDVRGKMSLRLTVCKHLLNEGIHVDPSQVIICNTLGNTYSMLLSALSSPQTTLLLEEESEFLATEHGSVALPIDEDGIMIGPLVKHLKSKQRSFLITEMYNTLPGGATYSLGRRHELMNVAQKYNLPIIESICMRDCWMETPPLPSLKSMDTADRIIYVFSLARPFMGIVMNAIIAPKALIPVLMEIKLYTDDFMDIITQSVLESLLSNNIYTTYMDSIRPLMIEKRDATDDLLKKYLGGIATWKKPEYGVNFRLNFDFDVTHLHQQLKKEGYVLYPPEIFCSRKNFIWFCFTGVGLDVLENFFKRIAAIIKN